MPGGITSPMTESVRRQEIKAIFTQPHDAYRVKRARIKEVNMNVNMNIFLVCCE